MKSKLTEKDIQALLMIWAMHEKQHILTIPNITSLYWWECDLLSMTKARFTHEFEIKRSIADYKRDFKKQSKHHVLKHGAQYSKNRMPNYFWFVTLEFDIDPPNYAGWIKIRKRKYNFDLSVIKNPPLLHREKITEKQIEIMAKILSFRLSDSYWRDYQKKS